MSDILILGDSTSMTIGVGNGSYPYQLAKTPAWKSSTRFVNCSQPGFTSADACAFFFNYYKKNRDVSAVIIHLGTCDSFSSEIQKGKYTSKKQFSIALKRSLGIPPKRSKLQNSLLYLEWNKNLNVSIEASEPAEDYEFNLVRIIKRCVSDKIPIVLISPFSHVSFPAGVGKGNFSFYRYLNLKDRLSDRLAIADERFIKALSYHESNEYQKALDLYKSILLNTEKENLTQEYQLLVTNNYAVCAAEAGKLKEAEYLFEILLKEDGSRKEIFMYNLAGVKKLKSDKDAYNKLMLDSYHFDSSMYRIRDPYLIALKNISKTYGSSLELIDIKDFVDDSMFVDHCHPLPVGQNLISDKILEIFSASDIRGDEKATIVNDLYNPELAMGNTTEFYSYYKTYAPFSESQIKETIASINQEFSKQNGSFEDFCDEEIKKNQFPKEILFALKYQLTHPCFNDVKSLLDAGIKYASDVGRFPELFIVRFVIPYIRRYENNPSLNQRFSNENELIRSSSQLLKVLPDIVRPFGANDIPEIRNENAESWVASILKRIKVLLIDHVKMGNQINERLKTTIYWFFRETLRFGTHSRISMRYDRILLEYTAESLAVASVLDFNAKLGKSDLIIKLINVVERITTVHNKYCSSFDTESDNSNLLNLYDEELFGFQSEIEALLR